MATLPSGAMMEDIATCAVHVTPSLKSYGETYAKGLLQDFQFGLEVEHIVLQEVQQFVFYRHGIHHAAHGDEVSSYSTVGSSCRAKVETEDKDVVEDNVQHTHHNHQHAWHLYVA